jgi:DNA-binding transcriptional LysR family regulator
MIQAVRTGSGVSLVNVYFVQDEIASGELIYPFPDGPSLPLNTCYLAYPPAKTVLPAVKKFRHWLLSEMHAFLSQAQVPEHWPHGWIPQGF